MITLAANLTMLFNELPFLDRFGAAASAGFKGVEYLFPYDYDAGQLRQRLRDHRLVQALHNLPAGNWAAGERGIACLPDRVDEFRAGVDRAIHYATTLGCPQVNCLAGITPSHVTNDTARATMVENLAFAAPRLGAAGIRLLIEAVNTHDIPGFFVPTTADALALIDEVGSDNLFLQYDVYHMTVMGEDAGRTIQTHLARVAHVQVADTPGRNEPGTGSINYPSLFTCIERAGYRGWIGCEYKPATTTSAGLAWTAPYLT